MAVAEPVPDPGPDPAVAACLCCSTASVADLDRRIAPVAAGMVDTRRCPLEPDPDSAG